MYPSPKVFIASTPVPAFCATGITFFGERAEVRVHHVDRHLHGVEAEAMLLGDLEHVQVDLRILVPGEADVADLAGLLRLHRRVDRAIFGKDAVADPRSG